MRTDQYDRLKQISEKLTDVVILESDPANWPQPEADEGEGGAKYFNEERALHWRKKTTFATLGILMRIHALVGIMDRGRNNPLAAEATERDTDKMIRSAEREVEKILAGIRRRDDD